MTTVEDGQPAAAESPLPNGNSTPPVVPPLGTKAAVESLRAKPSHQRSDSRLSQLSRRWSNALDKRLETRKSLVSADKKAVVRERLTEQENVEVDDVMLNQFLRATKQDVDKTIKRLKETVAWRLREQPHTKLCNRCIAKPRSHWLHVVGYSKLDQPIIYSCFAMAKDHDVNANREHMLVTFEQAVRAMPPHVEQWIWICDYHGFGLRDCDPRLAKIFLDVSEKYYPERLAEFLNVSTPSIFSMLWKAIEGWVDPYTREKVKFIGFDGKRDSKKNGSLRTELTRLCDDEMQEWIIDEMVQNRQKQAAKTKVYPYGKVHAPEGDLKYMCLDGHDARGSSDWIKAVQEDPGILAPMAKAA